jgi:hypothetical protein
MTEDSLSFLSIYMVVNDSIPFMKNFKSLSMGLGDFFRDTAPAQHQASAIVSRGAQQVLIGWSAGGASTRTPGDPGVICCGLSTWMQLMHVTQLAGGQYHSITIIHNNTLYNTVFIIIHG